MTKGTRFRFAVVVALALLTGLAACDSSSDDAEVKDVVSGFLSDLADGKGTEACDRLTTGTVRVLSAVAPAAGADATCPANIEAVHGQLSEEEKEALRTAEVKAVTINGDTATIAPNDVEFTLNGESSVLATVKSGPVTLQKIDDEWKIESLG